MSALGSVTDLSYLEAFGDNDREFIHDMIETFLRKVHDDLTQMQIAAEGSNWRAVYEAAHKLKPSVTFMGIHPIKEDIVTLERYAHEGTDPNETLRLVERVRQVCEGAATELEQKLSQYA
ncbi:MAG: Hpt domain-containing protein [Catalinimonas sp.]